MTKDVARSCLAAPFALVSVWGLARLFSWPCTKKSASYVRTTFPCFKLVKINHIKINLQILFPTSFAVTEEEKDLIARGKFDALIEQQKRTDAAIEEEVGLIHEFH